MPVRKNPRSDINLPGSYPKGMSVTACLFIFMVCFLAIGSCHLDYGNGIESKNLKADVPDTVMEYSHVEVVRDNVKTMVLSFDRAEVFVTAGKRVMTNVEFTQYGRDGGIVATGSAKKAEQSIQTDDVQFSGGLRVDITSQDARIEADGLEWKAQTKTMVGLANQQVKIFRKDGSSFSGFGFIADFVNRTMEMSGGIVGQYVYE